MKFTEETMQAVREILMKYCDPKPEFDGMTAWEIAGKIEAAIKEYYA